MGIFAPTDTAIQTYEKMIGPFDAAACKLHIVAANVPSASVGSADLTSISGEELVYRRAFRKDFVNDAIIGEKTFGQFADFPTDVTCSNGLSILSESAWLLNKLLCFLLLNKI